MFKTYAPLLGVLLALTATVSAWATGSEVKGRISALIPATPTTPARVTIATNRTSVTLNVTNATQIRINDRPAVFANLLVGDKVEARFDRRTLNALRLKVEREEGEARGVVRDADPLTGDLDIDTNGDGLTDLTVIVTPLTRVRIGDLELEPSEIDLLIGLPVKVEFDPITFEALEIEVLRVRLLEQRGVVASVNAGAGTLLLQGGTIPFQVPFDADIRLNNRPVALSALLPGDLVHIVYILNGENVPIALQIQAKRPVALAEQKIEGRLVSVNVAASQLVVRPRRGPDVTLAVNGQTVLRLDGRVVTLQQLADKLARANATRRTLSVSARFLPNGGIPLATKVEVQTERHDDDDDDGGDDGDGGGGDDDDD